MNFCLDLDLNSQVKFVIVKGIYCVMGSHSFCANLTHFEVGSHSSEAADLDRSGGGGGGGTWVGHLIDIGVLLTELPLVLHNGLQVRETVPDLQRRTRSTHVHQPQTLAVTMETNKH